MNANKLIKFLASGLFVTLTLSSCVVGSNYIPAEVNSKSVSSIKLISPNNSLYVGDKMKLSTIILQSNGEVASNPEIEWNVSDSKLASVGSDGTMIALGEGKVTVTAKYRGKETSLDLNISSVEAKPDTGTGTKSNPQQLSKVKKIVIKRAEESVPLIDYNINALGDTLKFSAQAFDSDNNVLNEITFSWTSSNPSIASVNSTGTVSALKSGATNIIATAGDKTSNIVRVIVPNGQANINVDFQGE